MGFYFESFTGNIGNVPLVLIAALCRDPSNPFADSETCSTQMTAYIAFGQWVCFQNSHFNCCLCGVYEVSTCSSFYVLVYTHK